VFGVWAVARYWGRRTATVCALVSLVIVVPPIGLTALAWNGGVALALWAVFTAARPGVVSNRRLVVAGVLAGFALLYRPDLVLALGLGLGAALWRPTVARLRPLLTGLVAGVSPILVHLAMAGPAAAFEGMFVEPVFRLRPGRSLPVPPSWDELDGFLQKAAGLRTLGWSLPAPTSAQQVAVWFYLVPLSAVFVAAVGVWSCRHRPDDPRSRLLRAVGFLGLGMLTQAMQRPDTAHFAWVSCIPLALVPVAVHQLLPRAWGAGSWRRFVVATAPVVFVVVGLIPHYTVRTYVDLTGQSFGRNVFGYPVNHRGRNFYYGSADAAAAANELVADLGAWSQPGRTPAGGAGRLSVHAVLRRLLLLPVPRSGPRHALHRDGPGDRQRPRFRPGGRGGGGRLVDPVERLVQLGRAQHLARAGVRRTQPGGPRPVLPGGRVRRPRR
jgi:hypothetical protein